MASASAGREEALEPVQPLELRDLVGDAALQRLVHLGQRAAVARLLVVQALLLQAGAHPRLEQHGLERLAEIVLGAELDAARHAVQLVQRRDHEHRDVAERRIPLDPLEHRIAVEVRHHHVEQHEIHGRARERLEPGLAARGDEQLVALAAEAARQHVPVLLVVVHDEDDRAGPARLAGRGGPGVGRLVRGGGRV
jgi:hypothetical protein